ncbi:MAG: hypothetical protein A2831_02640 [Candidatus Yanofskybacteria bacterium RIFCSPHIGHO2_01_FULL_44_17]|uniref:VWFA domain-containing protein n=1 Tax=Candidatus Yanofskybacteria bacterium RIFCSPHIGHO2_01_FULL_44_17 TaxID=1802668 RepID=A0A1F8EWR4_9BACT|nr:MAG: hypothetical protein A2831_02640 [Candidatus Yanofskybacteria bacterium RIFCSPHIGHO2_01_FULL_44_17]
MINLLYPKFDPEKSSIGLGNINFLRSKATLKNLGRKRDMNLLFPASFSINFSSAYKNKFLVAIFIFTFTVSMTLPSLGALAITPSPTSAPNPILQNSCGLDVALVIDNSGSINSTELNQMKAAFKGFVDTLLPLTPTEFSITAFNTVATKLQDFSNNTDTLKSAIDNVPLSHNLTNWEDALIKADDTFDPRPTVPNLIVFASDGEPTVSNETSNSSGNTLAYLQDALPIANAIKSSGTRIVTLGIGIDAANEQNMKYISSDDAYYSATNFSELSNTLNQVVTDLCGGKILIQKQIDTNGDGIADITAGNVPDPLLAGYTFDVSGTPSNPGPQITIDTGSLELSNILNGTYSVSETNIPQNSNLSSVVCMNGNQLVGTVNLGNETVSGLTMGTDDTIVCTFLNANIAPTPTPAPTLTPTPTPTPEPTSTPTPEPTPTPTPEPTPTPTPEPTPTTTPTPAPTETPTPSPSPTPTPTPTPTSTPTDNGSGGGGGSGPQGEFINGPLANPPQVLGAAASPTPLPKVLGAAIKTLPDTGASMIDRLLMSIFLSVFVTGAIMVLMGYEKLSTPILRKI